jgi:hypothetical protein
MQLFSIFEGQLCCSIQGSLEFELDIEQKVGMCFPYFFFF